MPKINNGTDVPLSSTTDITKLKSDTQHFKDNGLDSGALYKRICKYLAAFVKLEDAMNANEGRVVVLPCKIGEKIYINDSNGNTLELTAVNVAIVDSDGDVNLLDWFGETVFTSREEAALKGDKPNEKST